MRSRQLAAVALLATACGPASKLDASSDVVLSGAVQTQEGAAVPSATVRLIRHPDLLQAITDVFVVIGSVGLACLSGNVDICTDFAHTTTGSDGKFTFKMKGSDTQGSTKEALTFTAFANCPQPAAPATKGCAVATDFIVQKTALPIPPLKTWSALGALTADAGTGNAIFTWPALEAGVGGGAASDYRVNITETSGVLLWSVDAKTATTLDVDRRVTQDFAGDWAVTAQRTQTDSGTEFHGNWYSSGQAYPSKGLNPLSRTAECYLQGPDGMPVKVTGRCPLTDGDMTTKLVPLAAPMCPTGMTCAPVMQNNYVIISLGAGFQHPMAALVLYDIAVSTGTSSMLAIETSNDNVTWKAQATIPTTPFQLIPLDNGAWQLLRIRIVDPKGQFLGSGNSEVAIYAPGI